MKILIVCIFICMSFVGQALLFHSPVSNRMYHYSKGVSLKPMVKQIPEKQGRTTLDKDELRFWWCFKSGGQLAFSLRYCLVYVNILRAFQHDRNLGHLLHRFHTFGK
nr:uncharacterized protein LOC117683822 [Crassostrea gigas]